MRLQTSIILGSQFLSNFLEATQGKYNRSRLWPSQNPWNAFWSLQTLLGIFELTTEGRFCSNPRSCQGRYAATAGTSSSRQERSAMTGTEPTGTGATSFATSKATQLGNYTRLTSTDLPTLCAGMAKDNSCKEKSVMLVPYPGILIPKRRHVWIAKWYWPFLNAAQLRGNCLCAQALVETGISQKMSSAMTATQSTLDVPRTVNLL